MTNQKKAYTFALTAVLLWSTVASAFKITLRHLTYAELLVFSSLISTIILSLICLFTGKFEEIRHTTKKQWFHSALLGLLNPFLYYLVLFKAYELLPAQQAMAINYTWALTLAALSVPLLRQRIGIGDFAGLVIGYAGILFIATKGNLLALEFYNLSGVALAFASTFIWALYWIYNTKDKRSPVVCLFQTFLIGLIPAVLYYLAVSNLKIPDTSGFLGAVYIGAIEMSLSFVLWLGALRLSENTAKISSLIFLSPCLALLFINYIVGEPIHWSTVGGLLLILTGLAIQKKWSCIKKQTAS